MSGILISTVAGRTVAPTPTVIGEPWGGGYYAGQISTTGDGVATHYLIVAPVSSGQTNTQMKNDATTTSGTFSVIDGPTNTANMDNASHPAAQFCAGLTIGGYTDWYMPAINELEVCYYNLKPTTTPNATYGTGANPNSVPKRVNDYTAGDPAQTSSNDFKNTGSEDFVADRYWSSTEFSPPSMYGRYLSFNDGSGPAAYKVNFYYVRAVRRILV